MAGELLLDTGPLVSLVDRSQPDHEVCVGFLSEWTGRVVSTEAVLTEATHLLRDIHGATETCIEIFLRGAVQLIPTSDASLARSRDLMKRYADLPMDYADATLVTLAEELPTRRVFTLDAEFQVYRIHGRSPFEIYPDIPRPRPRGRKRMR